MYSYPILIPGALSVRQIENIQEDYKEGWSYSNSPRGNNLRFWGNTSALLEPYFDCWSTLSLKIRKYLNTYLSLYRVHINGQTFGQRSEFHTDLSQDFTWTCVVFTQPEWNQEWGGEFVLFDREINFYRHVPYMPNLAVVFPANWEHKGNPPLSQEAHIRTSVAFTFYDSQKHQGIQPPSYGK